MTTKNSLVTGGAGYIGSHTCLELIKAGFNPIVIDNFSNSSPISLERVSVLTGEKITVYEGDVRNRDFLNTVMQKENIDSVIHFAGLKAVGESVEKPLKYYDHNISGSIILFNAMRDNGIKKVVFSSSATVYGDPHTLPITEDFPLSATNPYGRSKLFIEEILRDIYLADPTWNIALLRYFNPIGAHRSGKIGEDPNDIPNNLVPFISRVAIGQYDYLSVFGNDYQTDDGTGVRDYIHVVDLAKGHVKALQAFDQQGTDNLLTVNLGTGKGYSVLDIIKAFEKSSGKKIVYKIEARRSGDIASCYADPSYAQTILNWKAERNLQTMCDDTWRWQSLNPNGYQIL